LFKLGHGLRHGQPGELPPLPVQTQAGPCTPAAELPVFERVAAAPYSLELGSLDDSWPSLNLSHDLESVIDQAAVQVSTVQIHTQQDAKRVQWRGPAQLYAASMQRVKLSSYANAALVFDTVVSLAPQAPVVLALADDGEKLFELDLTTTLRAQPLGQRKTIKVPLVCFAAKGADLDRVTMPFSITTTAPFTAAFARIRVVAYAAKDADALPCARLQPL
jgi:beta-glucosidase